MADEFSRKLAEKLAVGQMRQRQGAQLSQKNPSSMEKMIGARVEGDPVLAKMDPLAKAEMVTQNIAHRADPKAKHRFIADSLNITKGSKVLDMACGWAPFTRYVTDDRDAESIG